MRNNSWIAAWKLNFVLEAEQNIDMWREKVSTGLCTLDESIYWQGIWSKRWRDHLKGAQEYHDSATYRGVEMADYDDGDDEEEE